MSLNAPGCWPPPEDCSPVSFRCWSDQPSRCMIADGISDAPWLLIIDCLVGAIAIQIGTNFANDAFDALQGADTDERVGPQRARSPAV